MQTPTNNVRSLEEYKRKKGKPVAKATVYKWPSLAQAKEKAIADLEREVNLKFDQILSKFEEIVHSTQTNQRVLQLLIDKLRAEKLI